MPTQISVTVLGDQTPLSVFTPGLTGVALWFSTPLLPALSYRKVGVLRLVERVGARLIIVHEWDVIYPGVYPVFNRQIQSANCELIFNCFRPGLTYSLYYG